MRLLERYILKELIPQFLTALTMIISIIVVSQLVRFSEILVTFGVSLENIFLPFLYIVLPFFSLTIPMAFLFGVVLTFGRLSADGEYPALLASGYPLRKSAGPVMMVALFAYILAALSALHLEAWGRREMVQFLYRKTQTELDLMIRYKLQSGVFMEDFLGYVLYAEKISTDRKNLENLMIAPGGSKSTGRFITFAPKGEITGSVEEGKLILALEDGISYTSKPSTTEQSTIEFKRLEIDLLRVFQEQILGSDSKEDDFRSYPPQQLNRYIDELKKDQTVDPGLYRRARYLLHQRIASPFAAVTFALFGLVLGVADPRRGKSWAYVGAIITIILGYVVMMGAKTVAERGYLPAPLGAWAPNILLGSLGLFLVYQKNRLPPSEGTLSLENLPIIGGYIQKKRQKKWPPQKKQPALKP